MQLKPEIMYIAELGAANSETLWARIGRVSPSSLVSSACIRARNRREVATSELIESRPVPVVHRPCPQTAAATH